MPRCSFARQFFLLSAVLGVVFADTKVVNGFEATAGQLPWFASILVGGRDPIPSAYMCAGTISMRFQAVLFREFPLAAVSDYWILTSAHCCQRNADQMDALFGTHILNNTLAPRVSFVEKHVSATSLHCCLPAPLLTAAAPSDSGRIYFWPLRFVCTQIGSTGLVIQFLRKTDSTGKSGGIQQSEFGKKKLKIWN